MSNKRKHTISPDQIEKAETEIKNEIRKISFFITEYNVELLFQKMQKQEFVIPEYQREFTWDEKRKSRFIESLIMGLPIPFLLFWENKEGKLEIVDGSQRLRTIEEYIGGTLTLTNLESIPSLTGTNFFDLLDSRQRKIKNISVRGIVLNENADEKARFDLFDRINTGSLIANAAEIRRGVLRGKFQSLVEDLVKIPPFAELAPVSEKSKKERIREELVARFFAYGDGLENYKDSPHYFIFDYTKAMNEKMKDKPELIKVYRERFEGMLAFVKQHFPDGFRKTPNAKSTPRVRFEAISIGVDHALRENPDLKNKDSVDISWLDDKKGEFKKLTTSDAANVKSKIQNRFTYVKDKLLGQ